jgi:poly-gamma-glutamate synthesis protein (capsule biosynthesis protein)
MGNVRLSIVGDLSFSDVPGEPLELVRQMDPGVRAALACDMAVANLEGPLYDPSPEELRRAGGQAQYSPARTVEALKELGIHAVSLANNHALDFDLPGLESTIRALEAAGIAHFGTGRSAAEAAEPAVLERSGLRVGFLGLAGTGYPAANRLGTFDLEGTQTPGLIRRARQRCDRLVLYCHEGVEAFHYPLRTTVKYSHRAVECGADLVVVTHPHAVQGIETYRHAPIAYSLGNFIMSLGREGLFEAWRDQTALARMGWTFQRDTIEKALILKCTLSAEAVAYEPLPILVERSGLPRLLAPAERKEFDAFLAALCEAFDRPDDAVWRRRDEVERRFWKLVRGSMSLKDILGNFHRVRWANVVRLARKLLR